MPSSITGVLRGRHPAAVTQETSALRVAYQALRTATSDAVLHRPHADSARAAFALALNTAGDQIIRAIGIVSHTRVDLAEPARRPTERHWP